MRKYERRTNRDYRITLECGCAVLMRNPPRGGPVGARSTFVCQSGAGHGYQVRWLYWERGEYRVENPGL